VTTTERKPARAVPWAVEFYRSAVAKKWIMALTGIALLGYVLVHMVGNLHLYEGAVQLNEYAEGLRDIGEPLAPRTAILWVLRIGLLAAFLLHVHAAYSLTVMNRRARPQGYQSPRDYIAADFASRTMRWTGVIVLLFVLYHLAALTWGVRGFAPEEFERGEVYANVVASFQNPIVAGIYILANIALAFHIYHGTWSLFQSLGVNNPRFNRWRRGFATAFAAVILIGNVSFPIMVLTGVVS
jgi:succinate dehydrogenase / fumarate reductase cytochrome b subunit